MTRIVDEAIAAGKFPESRRQHYESLLKKDPAGTKALIARLSPVPALQSLGASSARTRGPIASSALPIVAHPAGGYVIEGRR